MYSSSAFQFQFRFQLSVVDLPLERIHFHLIFPILHFHITLDFVLALGLTQIWSAIWMYLLLERGHKGSSILSSLFCVLGWPGLPLWWPQDVALVSCCVFCFRFFFFVFYLTKVFLTLFLEVFLLLVFEIFSLFIWGLCVNFVLLLKFFFFLCCCLTLCCCCCDKPKGAKRHDDDDDVLISLSSLFTRWRHAACVPPRFISIPKCG